MAMLNDIMMQLTLTVNIVKIRIREKLTILSFLMENPVVNISEQFSHYFTQVSASMTSLIDKNKTKTQMFLLPLRKGEEQGEH